VRLADDSDFAPLSCGALTANNGTLTASAPVLDLAQTWNNAVVTFTGLRANFTNTASAAASRILDLQVDGTTQFAVRRGTSSAAAFVAPSQIEWFLGTQAASIVFDGTGTPAPSVVASAFGANGNALFYSGRFGSGNIQFRVPSGNVVEQYNTTNPQTFNIYNTFTSTTNHERGFLKWSSNVFQIGTEKGSAGGTARALEFQTDGTTRMTVGATGIFTYSAAATFNVNTVGSGNNTLQCDNSGALGNGRVIIGAGGIHDQQLVIDPRTGEGIRINGLGTTNSLVFQTTNTTRLTIGSGGGFTIADANNIAVGTTTGTKIGTATSQKIGFFNATPVVQQALTADLLDSLQGLGLVASGSGNTPLNLSGGTLTAGNLVLTDNTGSETATFDAQAKLTANRTYDLPDASGTLALTSLVGTPAELVIACSDETSNLTTGTAKVTFRMPYAMTLSSVRASVKTAPTGSTLIVDINEGGSTILSTKLSIDASELTSTTAATAAVISDTALADDAEVTIDIDQIGSTVAGKGLKVVLKGTRA
jgi:hypothetical protein